ncbi:iron ABC transporter permease [Thiospirochaeta perfilievii]|uniref:Iron ABC transporter permease n=1 Tax=Thiospirochaeta perfilievii TaxID=252967 RepID=A0A5C1QBB2_9SPIO|nr:iron ABC transporter permease [Thiospirochaeta perfilievii]QEN03452.1 iron ABC transporter permease [Thiospirochaeta perfilievii]
MKKVVITSILLWVLFSFILFPMLKTFQISLTGDNGFSIVNYIDFFSNKAYVIALKNSITIGLITVLVCGVIGTTLAFLINFIDMPFKNIIDKLLMLPIVLPGLIIVFAFMQLYGESGIITKSVQTLFKLDKPPFALLGLKGIIFIHAYTQYVFFYMNVSLAIKQIDRCAIDAAINLGSTRWQVFTKIIIPFTKPALIASAIITFMTGIGSFSAPSIIGGSYKVMTTQILLSKANNFMDVAATQVVILTLVSLTYLGVLRYYENKIKFRSSVKSIKIKPYKVKNNFLRGLLLLLLLFLILSILLPVITIVVLSFVKPGTWMIDIYPREFSLDNYIRIFQKSRSLAPFINSLFMALITALISIVVAIPASYIIVKTKSKFKLIIELLIMLPWAIPSSAIAINMINAFNKPTVFSGNKILVGTFILLPLAYFVSLIPLMFRSTTISLQHLNDTYIEASKSLKANHLQTFRRVILPLITPGVISGVMLIVIRSIGEYTISAFLYTVQNRPISIAMVNGIFEYEIGLTMAYGSLIVLLTLLANLLIGKLSKN